jgi:hypothetical protein
LAIGAARDDGNSNQVTDSGAVHLFKFASSAWSQTGSIGYGYTAAAAWR